MTDNADPRSPRLSDLRRMLQEGLIDPTAAIDALLGELEHGELRTADWEALHAAAERDDREVELGTAYQQVLTRPRLQSLDVPRQVRVLMHAADFFQGILGDGDLAHNFLMRVLEVDPDHVEAFDRLERAFTARQDPRGLVGLYALVARNPPLPPARIAQRATEAIAALPDWMALSEDTCSRLLAIVPAGPALLDALDDHCRRTGRLHLAHALRERGFYFQYAAHRPAPSHRPGRRPSSRHKVQIHGFAPSTYTRTARLACIEKGVPHELVPLDFRSEQHAQLHPFLKMPALTYGSLHLYETLAICTFVDRSFAGPPLIPEDAVEHARMAQWISTATDYLYRSFVVALREARPTEEGRQRIDQGLHLLERELAEHPYLAGKSLSLAELFVAPMVAFAADRGDFDLGRTTRQWLHNLRSRPSFRKTETDMG